MKKQWIFFKTIYLFNVDLKDIYQECSLCQACLRYIYQENLNQIRNHFWAIWDHLPPSLGVWGINLSQGLSTPKNEPQSRYTQEWAKLQLHRRNHRLWIQINKRSQRSPRTRTMEIEVWKGLFGSDTMGWHWSLSIQMFSDISLRYFKIPPGCSLHMLGFLWFCSCSPP